MTTDAPGALRLTLERANKQDKKTHNVDTTHSQLYTYIQRLFTNPEKDMHNSKSLRSPWGTVFWVTERDQDIGSVWKTLHITQVKGGLGLFQKAVLRTSATGAELQAAQDVAAIAFTSWAEISIRSWMNELLQQCKRA